MGAFDCVPEGGYGARLRQDGETETQTDIMPTSSVSDVLRTFAVSPQFIANLSQILLLPLC